MEAVKDYVGGIRQTFEEEFREFCETAPMALESPKSFKQWSEQAPTMFDLAKDLGLDTARVVRTVGGGSTGTTPARIAGRGRTRSRARRPGKGNGAGGGVSSEKILAELRHGHTSQTAIAEHLKISRQTVAKKLDRLVADGLVEVHGAGMRKTWHAKERQPA